jgi:predicted amidohydrolase
VARAAAAGADLLVLPELCPGGYVFADADEAPRCAEPLDGPTVRA